MKNLINAKKELEKEGYSIIGKHSAVKICLWNKNSLRGKGVCWKEKFYGIKSHRCAQISCSLFNCENKCVHCWRNLNYTDNDIIVSPDDPKEIIDKIVEARKKLLMGFKGNKKVDAKKFAEALEPTLFTMSLSGEPTIYPRLAEMIKEIRRRGAVSFLVTNGQNPKAIAKLEREDSLPTQLTVSMNAPNKKLFKIWHRSTNKDSWERFNETLDLMKKLKGKVRKALRMTLVKKGKDKKNSKENQFNDISNMEDENVIEYATLIKKAQPDFVHVKGFMSVGYARDRMGYDKMPWHREVREFANKLVSVLADDGYKVLDEEERSCVVVLGKNKKDMKIDWKKV